MSENQAFCIDIINLVPIGSTCFIQAPNLENSKILNLMTPSKYAYYREIKLTELNKKILIEEILSNNIQEEFQSIEIKVNNKLLFEGYDGMEFGVITNTIVLPNWFVDKHIKTDMCAISEEW
jgi:hypothetical protein